jgi:hypothetical protein
VDLSDRLDAWVRAGLITRSEADGIAAFEGRPGGVPPPTATPAGTAGPIGRASASEGLAYLGAALAIAAGGTLLARIWGDLSTPARILIPAVVAMALFVVGWRLRDAVPGPLQRLCAISWFFSAAALGWATAVAVSDGLGLQERATFLGIGTTVVVYAGALYLVRPVTIQQLAVLTGAMFLAIGIGWGTATGIGWIFWIVGVGWILLGARGLLVDAPAALSMGSVVVLFGCLLIATGSAEVGTWVGVVSSAGLIGAGVALRSQQMLVLGVIGLFFSTLAVVRVYVEGSTGIAIGLLAAAAVVLAAAFVVSRFDPAAWRRRRAIPPQVGR